METIKIPITGDEISNLADEETKSLSLFYKAFNYRDMKLMAESWLKTDEISMDNPMGGIRRGWQEISNGYYKIFNGNAKVYVEFYDYTINKTVNMFFATGRERGYFKTEENSINLAIRTTRIFKKINGVWKQIHHHGSIDKPELLEKYQKALQS